MITLLSLPWKPDAMHPFISAETISYHYGKHHQAYLNNLNQLIQDTLLDKMSLEEIVKTSSGVVFNNAAQVWNHNFYWESLTSVQNEPSLKLKSLIDKGFGSMDSFISQFSKAAVSFFGSGWAWLILNESGELELVQTSNANTPLTDGVVPLLVCDVWEHAYYLDYQNRRADYIKAFWNFVNWDMVEKRMPK